jgi:hypothetical protein
MNPVLVVRCPLVQPALDPEYPLLRQLRLRQRRDAIQRRPLRLPDPLCKPAASLRHVPGSHRLELLRRLRPVLLSADDGPAHPHKRDRAAPDGSHVHYRSVGGSATSFPLTETERVDRPFESLVTETSTARHRCRSRACLATPPIAKPATRRLDVLVSRAKDFASGPCQLAGCGPSSAMCSRSRRVPCGPSRPARCLRRTNV